MKKLIVYLIILSVLSSCATLLRGTKQLVFINTLPEGASIIIDSIKVGTTPAHLKIKRLKNKTVFLEKEGFKTSHYTFYTQRSSGWAWLNVFIPISFGISSVFFDYDRLEGGGLATAIFGTMLAGSLIDFYSGGCSKIVNKKTTQILDPLPKQTHKDSLNGFICHPTIIGIKTGQCIGKYSINNNIISDIIWENEIRISGNELRDFISVQMEQYGYKSKLANDELIFSNDFELKSSILDIKSNVNDQIWRSDRSLMSNWDWGTVDEISIRETKMEINVRWELLNKMKKTILIDTITGISSRQGDEGKVMFFNAFSVSLSNFINKGHLKDLLKKKTDNTEDSLLKNPVIIKKISRDTSLQFQIKQELDNLVNSVVTIKTPKGHGSGFFITEDGLIVTNAHVAEAFDSLTVILNNGIKLKASIKKIDFSKDLALLQVDGSGFQPLCLKMNSVPKLGMDVFAIGTPADLSFGQTITRGIISGKREIRNIKMIQTDCIINQGSSGGPLLDTEGEVIGIVTASLAGDNINGIGFAIQVSVLTEIFNILYVE